MQNNTCTVKTFGVSLLNKTLTAMTPKSISDIKKIPFFSQFTDDQIKAQVAKNAKALRHMESKSKASGKKVNGYTSDELDKQATHFESLL